MGTKSGDSKSVKIDLRSRNSKTEFLSLIAIQSETTHSSQSRAMENCSGVLRYRQEFSRSTQTPQPSSCEVSGRLKAFSKSPRIQSESDEPRNLSRGAEHLWICARRDHRLRHVGGIHPFHLGVALRHRRIHLYQGRSAHDGQA